MTSLRARLRLGAATGAMLALPLCGAGLAASPASAASPSGAVPDASSGPDYCTTDEGVTVVVDLSALDGPVVVRCVDGPLTSTYTGWDALSDAGFSPQAPSRTPGFVCRLVGEPAESRSLDIPESADYHEQCVNTPPTSAFWGYWYAKNGGSWTYSSLGAASHRVIEGGFEGWAFALNSGGHPPKPAVAPSHAVDTTKPPPSTVPGPSGGSPTHPSHSGGGVPGGGAPSTSSPGPTTPVEQPTDQPNRGRVQGHRSTNGQSEAPATSAAAGPTSTPPSTGDVVVTSDVPTASGTDGSEGSAGRTLVGLGVLAVLGAGAGVTAWRRSHRA